MRRSVQCTCFQWGSVPLRSDFRYQGNKATPAKLIPLGRQLIVLQLCRWQFLYNETLQQTFRPLLSKLSKRRQIQIFDNHFEEVRGGIEPWLMAHWKACVDFLLTVMEHLFLSLTLTRYKAKRVKTHCFLEWVGQFQPRFQGKGSSLGNIFWFPQN